MIILYIALGIILADFLLGLAAIAIGIVFSKEFWEIMGCILLIILCLVFLVNIKTISHALAPIFGIFCLVAIPIFIYVRYTNFIRYAKIKFILEYYQSVVVQDKNGETVATYDFLSCSKKVATEKFFKEKGLDFADYSVKTLKKTKGKEVLLYTRKKNVKFSLFVKTAEDNEHKD